MATLNTNMLINSNSFEIQTKNIFKILLVGVLALFVVFTLIYNLVNHILLFKSGGGAFFSFMITIGVISNSILALKLFNKSLNGAHNFVIALLISETILRGLLVILVILLDQDIFLIIICSLVPSLVISLIMILREKKLFKIFIYRFYQIFFVGNSLSRFSYLISFSISHQGLFFLYLILSQLNNVKNTSFIYIVVARLVASLILTQQYLFLDDNFVSKIKIYFLKYFSFRFMFFLVLTFSPFFILYPVTILLIISTLQFTYFVFVSNRFVALGKVRQASQFWLSHAFLIVLFFMLGIQFEAINPFYFSYFFSNLTSFFIFIFFFKDFNLSSQD